MSEAADPTEISRVPPQLTPWPKGVSGNPGGRPKVDRTVSAALAELQDTQGENVPAIIDAFKAARGVKLCGADFKAIAAFQRELDPEAVGVSQHNATLDRLEGKVAQRVEIGADAEITAAITAAAKAARE